ncbi:protein translocase subunit SecDF [Mycoplasmopsis gallinarum]|uniref:protein translocase subunit SecDF n=1 Tax=Mycoplasmopsis gallinarum TaxID=29557 RepID=UPI00055B9402|nr:protein translocase subunit SecDF [Mycoplasmopsis gallinarum]
MFKWIKKVFRKIFSITNWKRITIAAITLIAAISSIVFGSLFYISKNINKSVEYGGGVEFLVQVKNEAGAVDDSFTDSVSKSIDERLTGGVAFNGTKVENQGEGKILITRNGAMSDIERKNFEGIITNKPTLVLTDINMKPLFIDNQFNSTMQDIDYSQINRYIPPLKSSNSAKVEFMQNGTYAVNVTLKDSDAQVQWTNATEYLANSSQVVLMWLNLDKFVEIAKTEFPNKWINAKENPYNFAFVNETPVDASGKSNVYKKYQIDAENYLVSTGVVRSTLTGESFTISGANINAESAQRLAANINYGVSKYSLEVLSSNYIQASSVQGSFESALLAGTVVFGIIAIFMIVNYGLLGALSTISMALYMFLTLLMFTILRGEYSPVTIAALIIGIGISVDANIITFERLKSEVYMGEKLKKALKNSNRLSLSSIIDANLTTLIVSFILFYFGTSSVRGFSLSLVFSVIFTLLVMLIFTRGISSLLINTGWFNKRLWLIGIKWKKINHLNPEIFYKKFDYLKNAKWFIIASIAFVLIAGIVFGSFAGINQSFWAGFNRSIEFESGINISIEGKDTFLITKDIANEMKQFLIANQNHLGINEIGNHIQIFSINDNNTAFKLSIETSQDLSQEIESIKNFIQTQYPDVSIWSYGISSTEAANLVKNALLSVAISFVGIIVYTLIRLKWTFSIAAIVGLIHDILMTIGFIVITRLQISPIIVAAMLSIIAFSINDTIVVFDRIRENITNRYHNEILDAKKIKYIANLSIAETIKRSLYTSLTTIVAVLVLLLFRNATNLTFNIVMIFGLAIGAYSSIFICTWVWSKLELARQKGIKKREDSKFWVLPGPSEQIFPGINDFVA